MYVERKHRIGQLNAQPKHEARVHWFYSDRCVNREVLGFHFACQHWMEYSRTRKPSRLKHWEAQKLRLNPEHAKMEEAWHARSKMRKRYRYRGCVVVSFKGRIAPRVEHLKYRINTYDIWAYTVRKKFVFKLARGVQWGRGYESWMCAQNSQQRLGAEWKFHQCMEFKQCHCWLNQSSVT